LKWLYIFLGIIAAFLAVLFIFGEETTSSDIPTQASLAQQAVAKVGQDNVYMIDVRTEAEWQESHAEGAVWWGLEEELKQGNLPNIAKDSEIYIYCRSGNRSAEATSILTNGGFSDVSDFGAFNNWTAAGGTTASGETVLP